MGQQVLNLHTLTSYESALTGSVQKKKLKKKIELLKTLLNGIHL